MNWATENVIVTGGNGFLGKAIIRALIGKNTGCIAAYCRNKSLELEKMGVEVINGDIRDESALNRACENRSIIFHCAAKAGIWGKKEDFFSINVLGTKNIVNAAYKNHVPFLIHTSSPSVVIGSDGVAGGDESLPYPERYLAFYPETKASAERIVHSASSDKLFTVAIRPHIIWGPEDPHILPRVISKALKGELVIIGSGKNLIDMTYIDNAAYAHIAAAEQLRISQKISGRAYFISDGKPVVLWDWINNFLSALGLKAVTKRIPFKFAYMAAGFCELKHRFLEIEDEPRITRFTAMQLAHDHYFDISAAEQDLKYKAVIEPEKALNTTIAWFKEWLRTKTEFR